MIIFETPRLLARRLQVSDAKDVLEWKGDPEVARYEYWEPSGLDEVVRELEVLASRPPNSMGVWNEYGLVLKETGKVVGSVSLKVTEDPRREAEIGFKMNRMYQRRGLATEAATALLSHAFSLGARRVFAVVDVRNGPSIALLERLGMERERHLPKSCYVKGEWCDEYIYGLPRK